jgi:hypothetical protein
MEHDDRVNVGWPAYETGLKINKKNIKRTTTPASITAFITTPRRVMTE